MSESVMLALFDPSSWTLTTTILMITTCILVLRMFLSWRDERPSKLPPCPGFWLPIIGHLHLLSIDLGEPFRRFRKDLGAIYRLYLGNRLCVVISSFDLIKDVLSTNGDAFLGRPHLPALDKISGSGGIFMSNGAKWKEHRMFTLKTLRNFGMGKSILQKTIHEETKLLFDAIDAVHEQPIDPKVPMTMTFSNILCSMVFGSTFQHGDETFKKLIEGIDDNLGNGLLTGVVNFLPVLEWIPGDPFRLQKMIRNSDMVHTFARKIIKEHTENHDGDCINDFVSAYINHLDKTEQSGKPTTFSIQDLVTTFTDLFGAGVETTVGILVWSIPLLAEHPDMQHEMFEEIRRHVGTDRLPTVEDRINLAHVEAFYMETTRYTQPGAVNAPRVATRDVDFHGYLIPAGSIVMLDYGSIMTDPKTWPEPHKFDPTRFLDELGRLSKPEQFIMFSLGKRNCVGESLARMELLLILSALVQRYEILCPEGDDLSMDTINGEYRALRVAKPYRVVFKKRKYTQ